MKRGLLLLLVACSGGGDDGGVTVDGGVPDGDSACGAAVCSASTCGTITDACGNPVECPRCEYDSEAVTTHAGGPLFLSGARVLYQDIDHDALSIATRGTPWTSEAVPTTQSDAGGLGLAVASDGTTWVLRGNSASVALLHETNGVWDPEELVNGASHPGPLMLASDDTVWLAYSGQNQTSGEYGVIVAHRDAAGAWTYQTVSVTNNLPQYLDATIGPQGPVVAWSPDAGGLLYAEPDGAGGYTTTTVDATLPGYVEHELAVRIDAGGRPMIAYRHDSAFDRAIGFAIRDQGAWQVGLASSYKFGDGAVQMASSSSGDVAIAYHQDLGDQVAIRHGNTWAVQTFEGEAMGGDFAIAYDGGSLELARLLGAYYANIDVITPNGQLYPADYAATCDTIADELCQKGESCAQSGDDCCISNGFCAGPESFCVTLASSDLCGDPSLPASVLDGCNAAVAPGTLTCDTATEPAVIVPAACPYTF